MPLTHDGRRIGDVIHNGRQIGRIYHGSRLVWTRTRGMRDSFARPDGMQLQHQGWRVDDHSGLAASSIGGAFEYPATIIAGTARSGLSEHLLSMPLVYTRERFIGAGKINPDYTPGEVGVNALPSDDGFIEVRVANPGPGGGGWFNEQPLLGALCTDILARYPNTVPSHGILPIDTVLSGVGIRLESSQVTIIKRANVGPVGNMIDSMRMPGGSFKAGDIIRMRFKGLDYSLWVAGEYRGHVQDFDPPNYPIGPGYRSMSVLFTAFKELLGPRRFSPSLDYVEMGS